ncbi:hypothetical protein IMZ48_04690, partial [Candidatus Bathyarchaeota archaeon]|nr:hypothetical protein [Candidatus Bathyarchaeota archaeon]
VDQSLITVHGRELPVPKIKYLGNANPKLAFGCWNMANLKFAKAATGKIGWACIAMLPPGIQDGDVREVAMSFQSHANQNCGMGLSDAPSPASVVRVDSRSDDKKMLQAIKKSLGPSPPRIALVFLNKDTQVYASIKRVCEVHLGIHTVCMDWRKARPMKPQYFGNVALKWNLKLGGINHHLEDSVGLIKAGDTMLVGYDVTHPTGVPEKKSKGKNGPEVSQPSIVGLVASIDKDVNQWPAAAWVHGSRQEVCEDDQLQKAFGSRIDLWKKKNGASPKNIVIYRDGVSEGQFQQVLDKELPRMRAACREKGRYPGAQPKLSIIVSVKRHHTRFYPTEPGKTSRSGNIRPGTVVDRGVTQARYWDFYLAAHECIQGKWGD